MARVCRCGDSEDVHESDGYCLKCNCGEFEEASH